LMVGADMGRPPFERWSATHSAALPVPGHKSLSRIWNVFADFGSSCALRPWRATARVCSFLCAVLQNTVEPKSVRVRLSLPRKLTYPAKSTSRAKKTPDQQLAVDAPRLRRTHGRSWKHACYIHSAACPCSCPITPRFHRRAHRTSDLASPSFLPRAKPTAQTRRALRAGRAKLRRHQTIIESRTLPLSADFPELPTSPPSREAGVRLTRTFPAHSMR